eukprot:1463940-Rhodomonas_salina.1
MVMDGHGSHFEPAVLEFCIANGIHLGLIRDACSQRVARLTVLVLTDSCKHTVGLGHTDLMGCVRGPWELDFGKSNCERAWEVTGIHPFTLR